MDASNAYLAASAHTLTSFAPSESVSFADQPDPVRRFHGDSSPEVLLLPFPNGEAQPSTESLPTQLGLESLSELLYFSLSLSGRRGSGDHGYFLRTNPSSGNLHAEESYFALPDGFLGPTGDDAVSDRGWTVWHYRPDLHALERRSSLTLPAAISRTSFLYLGSHIPLRQSWKYGLRGLRYSLLDLGHAASGVAHSAGMLGWTAKLVGGWGADAERLIGKGLAEQAEKETLGCVVLIQTNPGQAGELEVPQSLLHSDGPFSYFGQPKTLARTPIRTYPLLDAALDALRPAARSISLSVFPCTDLKLFLPDYSAAAVRKLFRARRSAQDFHSPSPPLPINPADVADLLLSLPALLAPFGDAIPAAAFFLNHVVDDMPRGLYVLVVAGDPGPVAEELKSNASVEWDWRQIGTTGRLFLLSEGWPERVAAACCCSQSLASHSLITLFPLSPLPVPDMAVAHLAAAHLVHALYLLAHACGAGATAMGCFADAAVTGLIGLADEPGAAKMRGFFRGPSGMRPAGERKGREWAAVYSVGIGEPDFEQRLSLDEGRVYDREKERRTGL
ncbi:hypothetical protein DFJ74DRAFT_731789 [Hyaloraphidium curvatum]|nr:hypothetical protein DFJ74DRAFT_731789 [Hyaloraphidium curvatum]